MRRHGRRLSRLQLPGTISELPEWIVRKGTCLIFGFNNQFDYALWYLQPEVMVMTEKRLFANPVQRISTPTAEGWLYLWNDGSLQVMWDKAPPQLSAASPAPPQQDSILQICSNTAILNPRR